jgi:hypothetical protein
MKSWLESLASANKDIFGMFTRTLQAPTFPAMQGNANWDEVFNSLQKSLTAFSCDAKPPFQGVDEFVAYSSEWQESYNKFTLTWLECLQKMAASYKAGDEEGALAEYFDASEDFLNRWSSFMTDQAKALFHLWKTSVIKAKEAAEKKGPGKKEAPKKKAPKKTAGKDACRGRRAIKSKGVKDRML